MTTERKSTMVSARLPGALVDRLDYAVRNTDDKDVRSRSTALRVAVEAWALSQEEKLRVLGVLPKKVR